MKDAKSKKVGEEVLKRVEIKLLSNTINRLELYGRDYRDANRTLDIDKLITELCYFHGEIRNELFWDKGFRDFLNKGWRYKDWPTLKVGSTKIFDTLRIFREYKKYRNSSFYWVVEEFRKIFGAVVCILLVNVLFGVAALVMLYFGLFAGSW